MDRKDRLKMAFEYARSKGLVHTQKDLASLLKASEGNVSKALKGDPKVLTDSFLHRFNEAFNGCFNKQWLEDGIGKMLDDGQTSDGNINVAIQDIDRERTADLESVQPKISYTKGRPYYNVDFIGGFDLVFNDQTINPEYYIDFAPYNKDGVMWCNITGHSMEPSISNGDIIAIKEVQDWFDYLSMGEIYAIVTTNNLRTVKIVRKGSTEEKFRFIPINTKDFDEQEVPKKMILRVFELLACIKKL